MIIIIKYGTVILSQTLAYKSLVLNKNTLYYLIGMQINNYDHR